MWTIFTDSTSQVKDMAPIGRDNKHPIKGRKVLGEKKDCGNITVFTSHAHALGASSGPTQAHYHKLAPHLRENPSEYRAQVRRGERNRKGALLVPIDASIGQMVRITEVLKRAEARRQERKSKMAKNRVNLGAQKLAYQLEKLVLGSAKDEDVEIQM
ncbi:hypothetical protein TWF730_000459 [Orbilia blumenaviensis]|uniref:Uncharacterized protein n=1 Tax=Orbilia blumenaviensis TaxID=1796055 RepID=A0AAV9VPC4_9PEZI